MLQRSVAGWAIGAALCALGCGAARAQADFPSRSMTMVVPLPAGGTADLLCRYAAEKASAALGQQVVVENRPGGAGGRVGMETVLRAQPDGYTLLCSPQLGYSITHLMFTKAAFDPRTLEPISVLAIYPLIVIVRKDFPANDLKGFVEYAKANPGKVTYGHQGKGNTGHLLGELMMLKAGFKMTEVPYRGSAPAINDTLSGNIDMVPDYLLANKQNIDVGNLKFLAVASEQRLKDYPNVQTMSETIPGVTASTWMAVSAPPGTPKEIAKKISEAIAQGFKQPDMQQKILRLEAAPLGTTPERMREMIKESEDIWGPVVKAANITID
ncbi:MAG: tripartite tricarboxylate transporter substrate binding protein [Hyphomicrobiales bacterium]|nr:tripartite tricarboxylate transporter substrate binding protein [Alphaproteobacteria bacterium]